MYLKAIRAYGFKSFADKLNIEFDKNITAIVGPNGSGKSNIVDAVKWVLGEQSVKSLRATDSMTDVIFSGSKSRDPLSRASVTLVFDNTDHYLNCEFDEVEIKRTVYKTGENEYYINNAKVRLKDITTLFLDTGAGSDSFNIISQGNVQAIIDSKPEARRSIFEAAAGVLKYKKRKEESLRKLEKTNQNIKTVNLLIDELNETITPLESQSKIAKEYLEVKSKLENLEISLTANEITELNEELNESRNKIKTLEDKLVDTETKNNIDSVALDKLKGELLKIEDEISNKNQELISVSDELASKLNEKKIMLERQKYSISDSKINENLVDLKEQESKLASKISITERDYNNALEEKQKINKEIDELQNSYLNNKVTRSNTQNELQDINRKLLSVKNEIDALEYSLSNDIKVPVAVKSVLNRNLDGVIDRIGNIYEVDDKYLTAVDIALGASSNFIICEDEAAAKKGIFYLKNANLGRATFFPLNVIKPKYIDSDTNDILVSDKDFLDIASNLVKCDRKYQNIIENQLGNVIVVSDIDALNRLGKKIKYRYRIISLDGEILHSGGSITGGSNKTKELISFDKQKLSNLKVTKLELENLYSEKESLIDKLSNDITDLENKIDNLNRDIIAKDESVNVFKSNLDELNTKKDNISSEINGLTNLKNNSMEKELVKLVDLCSDLEAKKNILEKDLNDKKIKRSSINDDIAKEELKDKQVRTLINDLQKDKYELENNCGKIEIKLENYLALLTENYNITYEKAKEEYVLDIAASTARKELLKYKKQIYEFGEVNIGAVKEYDRLKERFDFLSNQRDDLESSCESLLDMISQMDDIMVTKFKEAFEKINKEFNETFKTMFKGGKGYLKLTDPNDLLNTGIDIIAEPPGKSLNSIALLSGGEKTLTAIALLFAILNVKTVPFCIFDEVEAALDERNVDTFGEYLRTKKDKSQFVLITHKKKTMEYADSLYGITMQESGVSKIVSVKLED